MKFLVASLLLMTLTSGYAQGVDWTSVEYEYSAERSVSVKPGESIQAAINSMAKKGGVVYLEEGVHQIDKSIDMKSNITLMGAVGLTPDKVIITPQDPKFYEALIVNSKPVKFVNIYNLTIQGNITPEEQTLGPEYHSKRIAKGDPQTYRHRQLGIFLGADGDTYSEAMNRNINLRGVIITSCAMGAHFKGTRDLNISKCYLHHNGLIKSFYHNIYLRRTFKPVVEDNVFVDSPTGNGINVSQSEDVTLRRNTCNNNFFRGLRVEGESGYKINYITIEDNTCIGNGNFGCRFANVLDGVVKGNTSRSSGVSDIHKGSVGNLRFEGNSWD